MGRQQRQRLVVVGSGWVGLYLAQYIDTDKYHVSIISPNRTSPYTPLLASAAVALIPFRYAEESIRSKGRDVRFLEANVTGVDLEAKSLRCEAAFEGEDPLMKERGFEVAYDKLVLAPGCKSFLFSRYMVAIKREASHANPYIRHNKHIRHPRRPRKRPLH